MPVIDPEGASAALWFYTAALAGWFSSVAARAFVRFYTYLDTLPPRIPKGTTLSDPRPRPLRTAAAIVGGLTALISGLVGAGLLTLGQGDALTGIITAALVLLGSFGITVTAEKQVTPLADPRDQHGRPLIPSDRDGQ